MSYTTIIRSYSANGLDFVESDNNRPNCTPCFRTSVFLVYKNAGSDHKNTHTHKQNATANRARATRKPFSWLENDKHTHTQTRLIEMRGDFFRTS